jgi:hypothetical protein
MQRGHGDAAFRSGKIMPPPAHRPSFSQDSLEQIRCREVTRIIKKMDPSAEEAEAIERWSRLLVARLLLGPISEAMQHAETWASERES